MPQETQPRSLPLPEEAFHDIAALVRNADVLPRLCQEVAGLDAVTSLEDLAGPLSAKVGKSRDEVAVIIGTLLALHRLREQLEVPGEDFLKSLAVYVTEPPGGRDKTDLSDLWSRGLPQVRAALDADSPFAILGKAAELVYSHQNVLRNARLLTDIRPVYDKGATKILRMVVTHQLVLDYLDGSTHKRLHVALDGADVHKLEEQCRRARNKAAIVQMSFKDMPWRTSVIGGPT